MAVRMDQTMPECLLYARIQRQVLCCTRFHSAARNTRRKAPLRAGCFLRRLASRDSPRPDRRERRGYRNLALNPCDQPRVDLAIYPHATSNSVARNLFDFAARNAIEGATRNGHHGAWPYQSWGPESAADAWWKVDFGRPVRLDKIRLMLRADFPHDGTWKSAGVEFSDGSRVTIQLAPTAEFQEFSFPPRKTTWLRLTNLVSAARTSGAR